MKLITTNEERKISTPAISAMMSDVAKESIEHGDKTLLANWENKEVKPCMKCSSTGRDLEDGGPCLGCEGSGTDFEIRYGVSDGVVYSHVKQYGTDAILEYCKGKREQEISDPTWKKDDSMGLVAFAIPSVARMELMAQGYPVESWEREGDMKSYTRAVQANFPMYLTTNVII